MASYPSRCRNRSGSIGQITDDRHRANKALGPWRIKNRLMIINRLDKKRSEPEVKYHGALSARLKYNAVRIDHCSLPTAADNLLRRLSPWIKINTVRPQHI